MPCLKSPFPVVSTMALTGPPPSFQARGRTKVSVRAQTHMLGKEEREISHTRCAAETRAREGKETKGEKQR